MHGIYLINDHIVLGYSYELTSGLSIFSPESGQISSNFTTTEVEFIGSMHPIPEAASIILQKSGWSTRCEIPTGTRSQTHQFIEGWSANTYGSILGNYYYNSRRSGLHDTCYLIRSKPTDLAQWDTVYTLVKGPATGDSRPNIQSYNLWIHPHTGDSILIFQHRMAFPERVDVVAYNMNNREIMWKHENITPNGNSNHQQIFIVDNKAFFGGSTIFFAFDLFTGKIIWSFAEPRGKTSFMIHNPSFCYKTNALIVRGGGYLYSIIPQTGSLNWAIFIDGDGSSGSPTVHNGIIYIT